MGRSVTQSSSTARLGDLIVPPVLERQVRDVIDWYAASARVEREYGLRDTLPGGPGLACLFSGPSGTGKTFAAQCIANELGLNLYRIDLSQVVSKYIGETEKALAQMFDEAEAGHGVLLFDEADALFGKRTEVKDAHDRYANVEVGYLLQRLESFSGIAILTTNLRSNIDTAFVRRLRFVFEFPLPDVERRERLWERALPAPHLRHKDLDLRPFVQRFRLSGGHIHSIGLAATHLAAATPDGLLGPEHLVQGTYRELEKAGLGRSAADFGPLADWLPAGKVTS
jgi:SpoVK/Ycf46/Vps4 family AAA+-type ATPase